MELYRKVDRLAGVKKSFIGSGIRYDLFGDNNRDYLREVVVNHVSGRLKVAPEHTEDGVLRLMRKPSFALFRDLNERFQKICRDEGLNYQLIPYFISSHPGVPNGICATWRPRRGGCISGSNRWPGPPPR